MITARERAQRIRQDSESNGETALQLLEALAHVITDLICDGRELVRGGFRPREAENLWTSEEACVYMRISRRTLTDSIATNELRHVRINGMLRFRKEDLDEYMNRPKQFRRKRVSTRKA